MYTRRSLPNRSILVDDGAFGVMPSRLVLSLDGQENGATKLRRLFWQSWRDI